MEVNFAGKKLKAETVDLNSQGLGISLSKALKPDQDVDLVFTLPDSGNILAIKSKVIWSKNISLGLHRAGLAISNPSPIIFSKILSSRFET